jgi:hypothetical protein
MDMGICFDWSEDTKSVGGVDGLARLLEEEIAANKAKKLAETQGPETKDQPAPSRVEAGLPTGLVRKPIPGLEDSYEIYDYSHRA